MAAASDAAATDAFVAGAQQQLKAARADHPLSREIPWSSLVTPHDVLTRGGDWLRVWRLEGVPFECADERQIAAWHETQCALLANLGGGQFSFWRHRIHRKIRDELSPPRDGFAAALDQQYKVRLAERPMMLNELYLTLVYRPAKGLRGFRKVRRSLEDIRRQHDEARRTMGEKTALIQRSLRAFAPELLGERTQNGVTYSEVAEFLGFLVNGIWRPTRPLSGALFRQLPAARPIIAGDKIEFRLGEQRRFATLIDVKEYAARVTPHALTPLLSEESEFIETMSFSLLPRRQALKALELQRNQLISSQDAAASQITELDEALDQVANGTIAMGDYHYSLMVFGDTPREAGEWGAKAAGAVGEKSGLEMVPIDLVAPAAWMAQWPAAWHWRPRGAKISTRAFSALGSGHNFATGKRDGNPWGEAVTILRTPSGQPFYFSFHVGGTDDSDDRDKKFPGVTLILGTTGAGKTTVEGFLLAQSQKFETRPRVIALDCYRGMELLVRAHGGQYIDLEMGKPTGCNPLQRELHGRRLRFLESWVRKLLENPAMPLLPSDDAAISHAVRAVAQMPWELRRLSTLRQNLPNTGENSLYDRLGKWCSGGPLGWVFDESNDRMDDLKSLTWAGIDYSSFLDHPELRAPVMMYLLDMMEDLIDGRPLIITIAEFWKALDDPVFDDWARDQVKTLRRYNAFPVFDTQSPSDVLRSRYGRTLVEQCVTKIFLANPSAAREDYVEGFGLTEAEYRIVKALQPGDRKFLVKQGQRSAVCLLDLHGMDRAVTILSSTEDNVRLLDSIRAQVGDDPKVWMPLLFKAIDDRRALAQPNT